MPRSGRYFYQSKSATIKVKALQFEINALLTRALNEWERREYWTSIKTRHLINQKIEALEEFHKENRVAPLETTQLRMLTTRHS
jgi:hypothetical protein